ncbi:hypothetical protein AOQ84DRAFT_298354 [Glonium stellatum]|uniref:SNF2 family helicase/ATPase n=1 Tax=Glonium stellatum TaxID=574774 RepID=A0A8E2JQG5_9PEZI|nr:hypothetical protein AOQ84DRAFT_298354 [Glonium stellatum]
MASDKDPWDWTIDEVVEALCASTRSYNDAGWSNPTLPDPKIFEQQLREQEVNGATLLTGVTELFLKEELNIRALGKRQALLVAIKHLRSRSPKYCGHAEFHAPPSYFSQQRGPAFASPHLNIHHTAPVVPRSNETAEVDRTAKSALGATFSTESQPAPRIPLGGAIAHGEDGLGEVSHSAVHARAGEDIIIDQGGRKRRKLKHIHQVVSPIKHPQLLSHPGYVNSYLGRKFPIDEIFYGNTLLGEVLCDEDDDDTEFFLSTRAPSGVSRYVYRKLYHFLSNAQQEEVTKRGKLAIAIYPYRESALLPGQTLSVTVFQMVGDEVRATREDPLIPDIDEPYKDNAIHEWDFLGYWDTKDKTILPPLGESEAEYSQSLIEEMEIEAREKEEQRAKRGPLTVDEVSMLVDQAIEDIRTIWQKRKLPLRETTAWTVWRKGRRSDVRRQLIMQAGKQIERLNGRLLALKNEISGQIWQKEAEVHRQCTILEENIFQREDHAWRISVWQRKDEPPRLKSKPHTRKKATSVHASDEEGISLGSDSEAASDDMSHFVDIGEIDMTQVVQSPSPSESNPLTQPSELYQRPSPELGQQQTARGTRSPDDDNMGTNANDEVDMDEADSPEDTAIDTVEESNFNVASLESAVATESPHEIPPRPQSPHSVIDLTFSSDASPTTDTPVRSYPTEIPASQKFNGAPENSSPAEIKNWNWGELIQRDDRKRLIIKLLSTIDSTDRNMMKHRIQEVKERFFVDELKRGLGALCSGRLRIEGVQQDTFEKIIKFSRLYICWHSCSPKWWNNNFDKQGLQEMVQDINNNRKKLEDFYRFLFIVLKSRDLLRILKGTAVSTPKSVLKTTVPTAITGSQPLSISDSEVDETEETPNKKRKRAVAQSQTAIQKRESAQQRRQEQELKEQLLQQQIGRDVTEGSSKIIVNTSKHEDDGFIFINKFIGTKIKKHQIEGVRFMWREVVTAGQSESQGCLLAHTMGLGKTMQTITLLVTIAEAAHSRDPTIRRQVPQTLRISRSLVICPASLVWNWMEELAMWIPPSARNLIGELRYIVSDVGTTKRLTEIDQWYDGGGILVMSYEMLRSYIQNKPTKTRGPPLSDELHNKVMRHLLEGPRIIIADEAHALKNFGSGISTVAEKFKSKSRIALTGSPLANSLLEYFAMINWISPGYLGDLVEFKAHYEEPIQQGLYSESNYSEYRTALKKLRILKNEIEPKVNRADITVLKGNLKPKVEFVITVPLTRLQEDAYKIYVKSILDVSPMGDDSYKDAKNTRIWSWLSVLSLLCNHPMIFFSKLFEEKQANRGHNSNAGSPEQDVDDLPISELGIPGSMMESQRALFTEAKKLDQMQHSYKMDVFNHILDYSEAVGDRVLVFSHRIPTLDYIEKCFIQQGRKYQRIDGKTKASTRQNSVKEFNQGLKFASVFLISTRAGGLGLNLPGANRVVIFDFNFNPTWEEQAVGRAYRLGQQKPVFVYRFLVGGTFESIIYNKAIFKMQLAYRVVDKKNVERQAQRLRDFLFDPKPVKQCDLQPYKGKDPHVLDRILALEGDEPLIRSLTTTETLQEEVAEDFTPEEIQEMEKMQKEERMRKADPAGYRALMQAKQMAKIEQSRMATLAKAGLTTSIPLPSNVAGPVRNQNANSEWNQRIERHLANSTTGLGARQTSGMLSSTAPELHQPRSHLAGSVSLPSSPLRLSSHRKQERLAPGAITENADDEAFVKGACSSEPPFQGVPSATAPLPRISNSPL